MSLWQFLMIVAVLATYFLPTIVAASTRHRQLPAIAAVNLLLGWTGLGWVAALVWTLIRVPQAAA